MNLFILDQMPAVAATYYCDGDISKTIVASIEMMSYAYDPGSKILPRSKSFHTRKNHPMAKWVRYSKRNFDWTWQHALALCEEYRYRQDRGSTQLKYVDWIGMNLPIESLSDYGLTDWPRCFGEWEDVIETTRDAVQDYRRHYLLDRRDAVWTKRPIPHWYV